jgi:hypothetical protein
MTGSMDSSSLRVGMRTHTSLWLNSDHIDGTLKV